jgi:hypothetical protein
VTAPRSWVALDLVGGELVHVYSDHLRHTYRLALDEPGPGVGIATVLINLTDDERAQWCDALREDNRP